MAVSSGRLVASDWFFEHAPDACYITDLDGHFVEVNQAAERMVGHSRDEMLGEDFVSLGLMRAADVERLTADFSQRIDEGAWATYQWIGKDGVPIAVEVRWELMSREGKSFVLGIARDVSNREVRGERGDVTERLDLEDAKSADTESESVQAESVQAELSRLQAELDERVRKRSEELSELNFQLNEEIQRHRKAEQDLDTHQNGLRDALEAAHVGTFRLDAPSCNPLYWSDECYRILGVDPSESLPGSPRLFATNYSS